MNSANLAVIICVFLYLELFLHDQNQRQVLTDNSQNEGIIVLCLNLLSLIMAKMKKTFQMGHFVLGQTSGDIETMRGGASADVMTTSVSIIIEEEMNIDLEERILQIMSIAVNNRTRERNYFKLYSRLLENKLSEDDFDRIIDENPDEFVQQEYQDYDSLDLAIARKASDKLMDVSDLSDMATLFSISNNSIKRIVASNG